MMAKHPTTAATPGRRRAAWLRRAQAHPTLLTSASAAAMGIAVGGCSRGLRQIARPFPHFSEAIMKAIFSMALVFVLCRVAGAADKPDKPAKVDPVGTWKCEYKIGDQDRTSTLTIKMDQDKVTGTMTWPDQKETELKDLKLTDDTLTFSAVRKLPGMDDGIPVDYKLKIDGDKLSGKCSSTYGGDKQEWDFNGKREKQDEKKDK
jgi:hypothetical protein